MANRVDTPMHPMQATPCDASSHRFLAQARATQLRKRHDAVLACCDLGHRDLGSGDFLVHW